MQFCLLLFISCFPVRTRFTRLEHELLLQEELKLRQAKGIPQAPVRNPHPGKGKKRKRTTARNAGPEGEDTSDNDVRCIMSWSNCKVHCIQIFSTATELHYTFGHVALVLSHFFPYLQCTCSHQGLFFIGVSCVPQNSGMFEIVGYS